MDTTSSITVTELWNCHLERHWRAAEDRYWSFVKPENLEIEREFESLDSEYIRALDAKAWFEFLLNRYFRWKYTAPNRFATTTKQLCKYVESDSLGDLFAIKKQLFAVDRRDVRTSLRLASSIKGLGTAGASGLLAVLFPQEFGTVDQFAVRALSGIVNLREREKVVGMRPENLDIEDSVVLVEIMRSKAEQNNCKFGTVYWTPRKIDKVLWTFGR